MQQESGTIYLNSKEQVAPFLLESSANGETRPAMSFCQDFISLPIVQPTKIKGGTTNVDFNRRRLQEQSRTKPQAVSDMKNSSPRCCSLCRL